MVSYPITPVPKPRMTQRDKWAKRPAVLRYRAFCDEVLARGVVLPLRYHVIFILPMPESWSRAKRAEMNGSPHLSKPDKDNLEKALLDALYDDDSSVWDGRVSKVWGERGEIRVARLCDCWP